MPNILPGDQLGIPKSIGAFGSIAFECSSELVRTFADFQRDSKARFAKHDLVALKPALEFLGEDAGEISFKMIFSASLGVNPAEETAKLRQICAAGEAHELVIGNEVIGDLWVIESLNETAQAFDGKGNCLLAELNVRLKEYGL